MEVDIEAIKRRLMIKYPLFGSIIANLKYISTDEMPTAATDGENLYYNPEFVSKLSKDEQTFLFAHEICHVAFDHIFRSEGKNPMLWNIATDSVINALLKQDKLKMVEGGVDIPEAVNYNAEQMYEKLLKEAEKKKQQKPQAEDTKDGDEKSESLDSQGGDGKQSGDSSEPQNDSQNKSDADSPGHDDHSLWKKAVENRKKANDKQNGDADEISEQSDEDKENSENEEKSENIWDKLAKIFKGKNRAKSGKTDKIEKNEKNEDISENPEVQEDISEMAEQGETEVFKANSEKRSEQLKELKETLIRETLSVGNFTNSVDRNLQNIGSATSLIDWRKMLKEAVKVDCDWSYANATIEEGVVTPHLEDLPKPETEIVLDTSGSIDIMLLRNFLRECKNILKVSKVKVGCFDTEFYGFEEVRTEEDIEKMKFIGGGDTDFNAAVNAFSRRVENKIIFTDGLAEMPNKPLDAIWIVFGNQEIHPVGGRTIYITPEQLMKLKFARNNRNIGLDR